MPGLSQLNQFKKDLLSLGDEITLRAARGEKPVDVSIPDTIEDKNDSEDFVLGMPEIEAEPEISQADEDLSDLAGLTNQSAFDSNSNEAAPSFEAPDMSSLLNPIEAPDDSASDMGMPDLSMFEDAPVEEEPEVVEEEPEEISVADMGLDALLSGAGFDQPEETPEPEAEETQAQIDLKNFEDVPDLDSLGVPDSTEEVIPEAEAVPVEEPEPLENLAETEKPEALETPVDNRSEIEKDLGMDLSSIPSKPAENAEPSLDDLLGNIEFDEPAAGENTITADDISAPLDFEIPENTDDVPDIENLPDLDEPEELGNAEELESPGDLEEAGSLEEPETLEVPEELEEPEALDEAAEEAEMPFETADTDTNAEAVEDTTGLGDFEMPDIPEQPVETETSDTTSETGDSGDFGNMGDLGDFDDGGSFDEDENSSPTEVAPAPETTEQTGTTEPSEPAMDFNMDDMDFGAPMDMGAGQMDDQAPVDFNAEDIIPDFGDDFATEDSSGDSSTDGTEDVESLDELDENQPIETFDTSEMDGMDFGIPDTDTQMNGGASAGDFELGGHDDFAMEGEFEIPGFSDVTTAKEEKSKPAMATSSKGKSKRGLPVPDFSGAEESEDLPPNTLSDAQYKQFLKNLSEYPLNVRLAFEDLIVQDEFTDDAEFEVIEKILNKAPARQVASMLEKMLDTSIPVPRDFEHRTAEEYEAYKKSLSYQLRNKIIPGMLVGIVALLLCWGIFNFAKNCIYKPLKANSLYKQGYALLQADEYPQSEMKFEQAVTYRINKKWFFNYARGYREHKQYQRAGAMYERILKYFKHDKAAGLEYADMELNDLANYERAEEIVRRQVLDYHINDADGILKLGDIFLEWGTEKDPAKLEDARAQYATLIQLYKANDLYMSRMMRYFIRIDDLRNVIQMQKRFEPREKSLTAEDWAELSGYLLEKYYGPLAPSQEYLRYEIEGLRGLLLRAVKTGPNNPIAHYNLAKYFINSGESGAVEQTLQNAIERFNTIPSMKKRDLYKYIDSYRLLGEHYIGTTDYLQAQEQFAEGISLYTTERDNAGFEGTPDIGKLYKDMGDIKYSISGDYDEALMNYKYSVELENDSPSIRYRIGYIQYKNKNYQEALGSFMKAGDGNIKERNLLLAMANTLSLRGDDYAAQGYYNQLIDTLDTEIAKYGVVFPQANVKDYDIVNTYLSASNNYGVTLYKLAKRTGNSGLNAQSIVQFQQSLRAWDALTRNQETMVRLSGSNLAEQNIQYITHPVPDFEPAIYTDISKTLTDNERL